MNEDNHCARHALDSANTVAQKDERESSWIDLRKSFVSMMAKVEQRFRSGNPLPVERAHLTRDEWELMGRYEEACEDLCTSAFSSSLHAQLGEARATIEALRKLVKGWRETSQMLDGQGDPGMASGYYNCAADLEYALAHSTPAPVNEEKGE